MDVELRFLRTRRAVFTGRFQSFRNLPPLLFLWDIDVGQRNAQLLNVCKRAMFSAEFLVYHLY